MTSFTLKPLPISKMLWISSQPTFHFISESVNELVKVVKQVEKKDSYTYQHSVGCKNIH